MAEEAAATHASGEVEEPKLLPMLLRDAAVVFAGLALWGGADAWADTRGLTLALVTAVGSALIAGWVIASLFHEWGHYMGAKLAQSKAPRMTMPGLLFFRYIFDLENNSLGQFMSMSLAGHIGHWGALLAAFTLLPMTTLAETSFVASILAFTVFATYVEVPIILRTLLRRVRPVEAFKHLDASYLFRTQVYGGIAGVVFLAGWYV